jgi:CspA family cold shock protein
VRTKNRDGAHDSAFLAENGSQPFSTIAKLFTASWHVARAEPFASRKHLMSATGTVKFFNATKGFGFISPDGGGKDIFVHATAVERAGLRTLSEGQRVTYDSEADARGAKAVNLRAE